MLTDFGTIFLFIIGGFVLLSVVLSISKLLRPHRPNDQKLAPYESGEAPVGNALVSFNVRFYVIALLFVLFEVELLFLFPWAVVFADKALMAETHGLWGWLAFGEMLLFVGVLTLGLAYAWRKGYLDWVRAKATPPETSSPVPPSYYEQVNKKYTR